jgi:hypothetical protein
MSGPTKPTGPGRSNDEHPARRHGDAAPSRDLARGLLTGLLLVMASLVAGFAWLFAGFALHDECNGSDASEPPVPGSDQAALCNSMGGGLMAVVIWIVPLLALAAAIVVGVLWTRGRLHGLWLLVSVAAMMVSPILVYVGLSSPDNEPDGSVHYERRPDAARYR